MHREFSFHLSRPTAPRARGEIATAHGMVRTPAFMPVGTQATVKGVHPADVRAGGADIVLGNTYHLMLRPGAERIAALGGLHALHELADPILTDSGGFQVMSLSQLRKLDESGVTFRSHIDGAMVSLTPERAIAVQNLLGADIVMQLDECLKLPATPTRSSARCGSRCAGPSAASARSRARGRGGRCSASCRAGTTRNCGRERPRAHRHRLSRLRDRRARGRRAAGGDAAVIDETAPALPAERPRYLMGVGTPEDLLEAVARGIDMFDCVLPTRNGRHGLAFTRFGAINLRNARHAADPRPLDAESPCEAARSYSRAYLHHLVRVNEMLGAMLLSEINLAYYQELMAGMRAAIAGGRFAAFRAATRAGWERGDITPVG